MSNKPGKPRSEDSKKADQSVNSDRPAKEKPAGKPLRRAGEGPNNLRQREEWFRRRAGSDK
jgi:hypothetical protein